MIVSIKDNRYLQIFAEEGEQISMGPAAEGVNPAVSLDLQSIIGIEGQPGVQGVPGARGQNAKEYLEQIGKLPIGATDEDFYQVLKGNDGVGVGIADIQVASTQNVTVARVDCDRQGRCKVVQTNSGVGATKTTLTFTLTDGTTKTIEMLAESGNYVSMNATEYEAFFGTATIDPSVQTYTKNGTTIYVVPLSLITE